MSRSPDPLVVQFLNVGQGDAAVVFLPQSTLKGKPLPRRALVIDAFDGNAVLNALNARNIEEIVIFFTHSDWDHVNGAEPLVTNFRGQIIAIFVNFDRSESHANSDYQRYLRTCMVATRRTPPPWFTRFDTDQEHQPRFRTLTNSSVRLRVLHPTYDHCAGFAGKPESLNDQSGVLRVEYVPRNKPSRSVLFTGDIQLTGISLMLAHHQADLSVLRADVLKFPHHGAWPTKHKVVSPFEPLARRTIADLIAAVEPSSVVISAGFDNTDGHVRPEVFAALRTQARITRIAFTGFTRACTAGCADPAPTRCAGHVTVTFTPNAAPNVTTEEPQHIDRIRLHTLPIARGCERLLPPVQPPPTVSPIPPTASGSKKNPKRGSKP